MGSRPGDGADMFFWFADRRLVQGKKKKKSLNLLDPKIKNTRVNNVCDEK